jgi:hypothetical protein
MIGLVRGFSHHRRLDEEHSLERRQGPGNLLSAMHVTKIILGLRKSISADKQFSETSIMG